MVAAARTRINKRTFSSPHVERAQYEKPGEGLDPKSLTEQVFGLFILKRDGAKRHSAETVLKALQVVVHADKDELQVVRVFLEQDAVRL